MKIFFTTLFISLSALSQLGYAGEHPGKGLVNDSCQQCHDNSIYTRSNSILQSYPELQARVEFCENAANAHWNETEINQVIEYLNDSYYKFPKS